MTVPISVMIFPISVYVLVTLSQQLQLPSKTSTIHLAALNAIFAAAVLLGSSSRVRPNQLSSNTDLVAFAFFLLFALLATVKVNMKFCRRRRRRFTTTNNNSRTAEAAAGFTRALEGAARRAWVVGVLLMVLTVLSVIQVVIELASCDESDDSAFKALQARFHRSAFLSVIGYVFHKPRTPPVPWV